MLVQRVVSPVSALELWTVLGDDDAPVTPIKAYAHDLKDWFTFLAGRGLDWREVRLEDVGEFVHHISKSRPSPRRMITLKAPKKLPRVLTVAEVQAILDACEHLRDRFLFAVLYDSSCRIGEALGL